jgi:TrmH family RNA methyltransferase
MVSKSSIKFIASLQQKKFRNEHNLFVAEGVKIVEELLLSSDFKLHSLYATEKWIDANENLTCNYSHLLHIATDKDLQQISSLTNVNEVVAVVHIPDCAINKKELSENLSLVLDEVKDPGNMGTIIRIADWFGIKNIICSVDSVDIYNPKVVQATMGSIFRTKIHYININSFLQEMKKSYNSPVYGALLDGNNVYTKPLSVNKNMQESLYKE